MVWLFIIFLVFSAFFAPVWIRYGFKEKDNFVLGAGFLQVGLSALWILLIYIYI